MGSRRTAVESLIFGCVAFCLYLPFRALQYDVNGVVEAAALETGQLINKNHILYRPIGLLIYRALQYSGYGGNSLSLLQVINAVCGAIGISLAYVVFKRQTNDRSVAALGSFWLATSFAYWMFSTDAAYITVASMFGLAAVACVSYASSNRAIVIAAVFTSLSILTWEASIFLVPSLLLLLLLERKPIKHSVNLVVGVVLFAGTCYMAVAFAEADVRPLHFWHWFVNYGKGGPLPLWGKWGPGRLLEASMSALRSVLPTPLGIWPNEITRFVQRGRILVDFALLGFVTLLVLAASKARLKSVWFLASYVFFVPFIVWWDPFEPKWFLIPNVFLAGFLACGLQPWIHRKYLGPIVIGCVLTIAAANFVTTIRPRHNLLGPDRTIAKCVADYMQPNDVLIAAEWGWPDYLGYLHARTAVNLINETASAGTKERMLAVVKDFIVMSQRVGGNAYTSDPRKYSESHVIWLNAQTGLTPADLAEFDGTPVFECSDRSFKRLPPLR